MAQSRLNIRPNQSISIPPVNAHGLYRALGIILGLLGLGVLAAALYLAPQPATFGLVFLGVGGPCVFLLWHRPEFGLLVLIFLAGSFIQAADIVDLRLPIGGGMDLRDLSLIALFGIVGMRELSRGNLKVQWWPVSGPLLLFLIIAVFSAFYALFFEHVGSNWAFGDLRILSLYVTFFITLWSIKRPVQLKILLAGLFIIADLTTSIVYLQQFLGADNPLLQAMLIGRDWRIYQQAGAVRVVPAGQVLMHFMWFVALGVLVFGRSNRWLKVFCVVQLLFLGGGHLFTYMRAQWVALIIGVGMFLLLLSFIYKQRLAKVVFVTCCVGLLIVGVLASGSLTQLSTTPIVAGITQRFASLLTINETEETGSLQWRNFEMEKALEAIKNQPLTGVGLGNRYRAVTTFQGEADGLLTQGSLATDRVSRFTRYVHNSYLAIAVKMGVPGLLALLWFCAAVLFKGYQMYRNMPDTGDKGVVLGILVGFAGLLEWSYFHAHLIKAESTATIGLMVALVGSIAYMYGAESGSSPLQDGSLLEKE